MIVINFMQNIKRGVGRFMKNAVNLTLEELDSRIAHFEHRLMDLFITEEQIGFIKEMLKELKITKRKQDTGTVLVSLKSFQLKL